jgi:bifunctional non-homologous end joining protein LigD
MSARRTSLDRVATDQIPLSTRGSEVAKRVPRAQSKSNDTRSRFERLASQLPGATRSALPSRIDVQLATLTKNAPHGDQWLHEIKYDGYRMICRIDGGQVAFVSRNHKDWTNRMPFLTDAAKALPAHQAILDGEVVVIQPDGTTDFQELQNAFSGLGARALNYFAFDLLFLEGYDLTHVPLEQRKQLLAEFLAAANKSRFQYSDHVVGSGPSFLKHACQMRLEGIISKRRDRPYQPGRGYEWLKVKCIQSDEFVIGGYTEPAGSRIGFGALRVGYFNEKQELVYAGRVGTGFNDRMLQDLLKRLQGLRRDDSPFVDLKRAAKTHWVEPKLVAQVAFSSRTRDGQLRHPSFQGLREDKPAAAVHSEQALPVTVAVNYSKPSRRRAPKRPASHADRSVRRKRRRS